MAGVQRIRVGVIGAGEVYQVCHGPCLQLMSHLFSVESICDLSAQTVDFVAAKFSISHKSTVPQDVIDNPNVDLVFILTSDESHAPLAIAALQAGKHVFIEKPVSLSIPSVHTIIDAEKSARNGARVFVGYMRRYAPSFLEAFKSEIATIPSIRYARVRDFSGPNAAFVGQSGTFQVKNTDYPASAGEERNERLAKLYQEAFTGQEITEEKKKACRFLGSLGSHDISLMRETLGFPQKVTAFSANDPYYSAMMTFQNQDGSPYSVTYETAVDEVPIFDAHIAVYGTHKRVTINYASPYVKGLPITVDVDEVNEKGERQHRTVLTSYEDTYTSELKELYECLAHGKGIKTNLEDALQDLQIFDMMYYSWLDTSA